MTSKKGYRGYCTHNPFGKYQMPVPAQNILYRQYADRQGLQFKLSVNEIFRPNCFLNLFSLLNELEGLEGILMSSIFMLPSNRNARNRVYQRILESGAKVHFVLENIVLSTTRDVENLELIFKLKKTISKCNTTEQLINLEL